MAANHPNRHRAGGKRGGAPKLSLSAFRRLSDLGGPLTFVLVVVAILFVMSVFFRVSDIEIEGNSHYTDQEIIRAIGIEEGDNMFLFDRFGTLSRVFAKLPYIEEVVSVERKLPNKVVITVVESQALAYRQLGDEQWTFDHNCKILGQTAEGEAASLIPVSGIEPGTLMIGEPLTTKDGDTALVEYLSQVLIQMEERGLQHSVTGIRATGKDSLEFSYGSKYTVVLGDSGALEHKFGMFVAVLEQLKEGDIGVLDVSDGTTAHFSPN